MPVPEGNYVVYNRVLSSKGERLAMTFNGRDQAITVTPIVDGKPAENQQWVIKNYNSSLQHFRPKADQSLEAGWGDAIYTPPIGNYVWGITENQGYLFQDGGKSIYWTLQSAVNGAKVVPLGDVTGEKQRWVIIKAGEPIP